MFYFRHSFLLLTSINNVPTTDLFFWRCDPTRVMASSFLRFLDHTQRPTTVGRTPLYEWSARRIDLYLTTPDTHNRQISMPPGGIRTHDLSWRAAADLRLRPRGHWDRHQQQIVLPKHKPEQLSSSPTATDLYGIWTFRTFWTFRNELNSHLAQSSH